MRKLNHFFQLLAVSAIAIVGHPDTALAALQFSPSNSVGLSIGGPGQTATSPSITVGSTTGTVTSLSLTNFSQQTGSGNWMCPSASGNIITVSAGISCGSSTTQLSPNTSYIGSFVVTANNGDSATVFVLLQVGTSGSSNGLLSTNPSSLTFTATTASQISSQSATVYYALSPITVTGVSFTPLQGGITFVSNTFNGSSVTFQLNGAATAQGTYTGTALINTVNGNVNLPISLTIGSGSVTGLSASPNPVSLFASSVGGTVSPVSVSFFYNGGTITPSTVASITTGNGQNWLGANLSGNLLFVSANTSTLAFGNTYSGTVNVNTPYGLVGVTVNLSIGTGGGGTAGLTASPNPVSLFASSVGGTTSTQTVSVSYNGSQTTPTSISSITTGTGQNWLNASLSGNLIYVSANTSILSFGNTYTGTVSVNTPFGIASFQVNLGIGTSGTSGLTVNPNPVSLFTLTQGGTVSPVFVTINYNGTPITPSSVSYTTSTGQSWLQAFLSGSQVQVTANTSVVGIGTYTGTVTAQTVYGPISIPVNLGVGTNGGSTSGLAATPSSLTYNIAVVGSGAPSQNVAITYNGLAVTIQSVSTNTNGAQSFLVVTPTQSGLIVGINGASLSAGTYTATITVNTSSGVLNIPVTLTVGSGGGSTNGLSASPNPVTLNTPTVGGAVSSQTVAINYNGSPASVQSVTTSTTTGQSWLVASTAGSNLVSVGANTSGLSAGNYTGTVYANTNLGTATFLVNLTVGSSGTNGLVASPNPVALNVATAGGTVFPQTVTVTYNGTTASITSVSTTTSTGGNWLTASSLGTSVSVGANTSGLAAGVYTGTVTVNTTVGTTTFQVNLTVGSGGSTSALTASPNPVVFQISAPGQPGQQTVSASYNGALVPIQNATFSPTDLFTTFVNLQINPNGTVTLTLNNIATNVGTYSGTLLLYTAQGQINVPVTLQIGSGGGGIIGLGASPNRSTLTCKPEASPMRRPSASQIAARR